MPANSEKRWWHVRSSGSLTDGGTSYAATEWSSEREARNRVNWAIDADEKSVAQYPCRNVLVGPAANILEAIQQDPAAFGLDEDLVVVGLTREDVRRFRDGWGPGTAEGTATFERFVEAEEVVKNELFVALTAKEDGK